MKDIIITSKTIKREAVWLLCCVVAISLWNCFAINLYNTSWSELYSIWYVVIPISILLYVVLIPIRVIIRLVTKAVSKKFKKR